jgi:hypothetical protein
VRWRQYNMNDQYILADLKYKQLQHAIKSEKKRSEAHFQFKKLRYRRWCIDNVLVFLIQFNGFLVNHYVLDVPLIVFTSGIGCVLLFLKGDAILPGLLLSAACAQFLQNREWVEAISFSLYQVIPLLCFKHYAHYFIAPNFIYLPIKKRMLLFFGMVITAAFLTYHAIQGLSLTYLLVYFFAEFNGLFISMMLVMMLDLYLVDWLQLRLDLNSHSTVLLLCALSLLLFALMLQGLSFFFIYDVLTILILQSALFGYALLAWFLLQ